MRVTRSKKIPITNKTSSAPIAMMPSFKNGAALFISNSASSRPPPFLNMSILLFPLSAIDHFDYAFVVWHPPRKEVMMR